MELEWRDTLAGMGLVVYMDCGFGNPKLLKSWANFERTLIHITFVINM